MVLQKRLEYGFNGYQVPPTPRAARSARRRVPSWKKTEVNNPMCAFDLLATVAGKLLQEGETSLNNSADKLSREESRIVKDSTIKVEAQQIEEQLVEEEVPSHVKVCDQGSCNRSFFVSEIISQAPVLDEVKDCRHPKHDTYSGPASGITVSDCSEKVVPVPKSANREIRTPDFSVDKVNARFGCKVENENNKQKTKEAPNSGKPPVVSHIDNSVKLPFFKDHSPRGPLPACQDNVNLVVRDDDENSSGCTQPCTLNNKAFKPPPRIGDRRIRRLLASKCWKVGPKLSDEEHFNTDAELKPVYRNNRKSNCYKRQRSLRDYPFKKRRLYELDSFSNSDGGVSSDERCSSPGKDRTGDGSGFGTKSDGGTGISGFAANQNPAFQAKDSHVKLKIKSFRIPELFIEIPETATIGSLKRTVMEAVTAILSGEIHVGVMLQGKKIRDDNKTLLQTGISHDNKLDALGFTLEPNPLQVPPSRYPEDHSYVLPPDMPKPLTRYHPAPTVANQIVVQPEVSDGSPDPPMTNVSNLIESDHDSAPSPPEMSVDNRSVPDSRALVTVPPMNAGPLTVVPMRKSKRAEVVQRRIRRPFSVSEVEALVQAVEKLGTGRWRDVKLRAFDNAKHRTYVDLKDKWKTLVHTARISPQQRRGEPVPQELLDRVLAAHAYWSHHQAKQQFKQQQQPETCRLL